MSLLPNVLAKQDAVENGAYEAWFVDREGMIRGFYSSRGEGPVTLVRDAERLIASSLAG